MVTSRDGDGSVMADRDRLKQKAHGVAVLPVYHGRRTLLVDGPAYVGHEAQQLSWSVVLITNAAIPIVDGSDLVRWSGPVLIWSSIFYLSSFTIPLV